MQPDVNAAAMRKRLDMQSGGSHPDMLDSPGSQLVMNRRMERNALARSSWIVIFDLANKAIAWLSSAFLPDFANKRANIPFAKPSKDLASSRAAADECGGGRSRSAHP